MEVIFSFLISALRLLLSVISLFTDRFNSVLDRFLIGKNHP